MNVKSGLLSSKNVRVQVLKDNEGKFEVYLGDGKREFMYASPAITLNDINDLHTMIALLNDITEFIGEDE